MAEEGKQIPPEEREELFQGEELKKERRNDWWKIVPQAPLDNDQWCKVLRQSLPEGDIPSQTCMARRALGPGPVQHTPSKRDRWLRGRIQHAEQLQEQLEWRLKGVRQTAEALEEANKAIWRGLAHTRSQRGNFSSWDNYRRQEETHWGEPSARISRLRDTKHRRKHL
uniref:Rev protein n=1 Tax=Equine infectious anemia virus TaxID=11665 RepID=K4PM37_9RETR|nr:rev protein [Equine infectious anemia virus]